MRVFKHVEKIDLPNLEVEARENGRFYITPEGKAYPSVTTVIGKMGDQSWLEEWKKRVGEEEARRISTIATRRGSAVHDIAEQYLRNNPEYKKKHSPINIDTFNSIRTFLDDHVGLIAGLELPLYSDFLRVAGRADCIAKWDGVWSVIDFKTSKKEKQKEDITGYYMQESCYSYMFYERTGMIIPQIVTVMSVDDGRSKFFVEKSRNYLSAFIEERNKLNI